MKPDKIFLSLALLIILTTFSWISSCTHKANIEGIQQVCYNEVDTIFYNSCWNPQLGDCHDGTGEPENFSIPANIINSVVPGNPDASRSYQAIIATRGENRMPPSGPISLDNRTIIRLWIEQGAKDNRQDPSACPVTIPTGNGRSKEILKYY